MARRDARELSPSRGAPDHRRPWRSRWLLRRYASALVPCNPPPTSTRCFPTTVRIRSSPSRASCARVERRVLGLLCAADDDVQDELDALGDRHDELVEAPAASLSG